jgi:hypothetical protein
MTRAFKTVLSGELAPKHWLPDVLRAVTPGSGLWNMEASRIQKVYWGKMDISKLSDSEQMLFHYMNDGGLVPGMSAQDRLGAIRKFKDAVQQHKATAIFRLPSAAIQAIGHPMFHIWIPNMKIAAYAKDIATAMHLDPTLLTDAAKRELTFRRIAKSVDNRFGEMSYDTLYWNRWVKDLAVLNTLSLGWQMGFIREYGGGVLEIGKAIASDAPIKEIARTGHLDRAMFSSFYTAGAMALTGMLSYALSGIYPQGLDWFYARSGNKTPDGKDELLNTPFYTREYASIYKHIQNEGIAKGLGHLITNKASGVIGLTAGTVFGINNLDQEVRDPNGPWYKKLEQSLAFAFGEIKPISVEAMGKEEGVARKGLALAGFTTAPKYATETRTEGKIKATFQAYYGAKRTPYERVEFSADARELRELHQKKKMVEYQAKLREIKKEYDLKPDEVHKLTTTTKKGQDPYVRMFTRLVWQRQKIILDQMTPEERKVYLPHSNKDHLRRHYKPPVQE